MPLKILSLEVKEPKLNLNKKYDLNQELLVTKNEAVVILQNILNFSPTALANPAASMTTTTEFQLDQDNIKLQRFYNTGQVKVLINDQEQQVDIYDWFSQKLSIKIDPPAWESRLIDFRSIDINSREELINLLKTKDNVLQPSSDLNSQKIELEAQFEQLKNASTSGIPQEQIQKIDRLRDIKFRISKIQKEVDSYQNQKENKDVLTKKIKEKEQESATLRDKLDSVTSLMESKKKIEAELQKFKGLGQQDVDSLKHQKFEETNQLLQTAFTKPAHKSLADEPEEVGMKLTGQKVFLIAQIPVTLTLVIFGYLAIRQELILLLGFILIFIEFLYIIFEMQKKSAPANIQALQPEVPQLSVESQLDNHSQDRNFINSAWKSAYEEELNKVDQLITTNLNNKTYDEVSVEKQKKESELKSLKNEQAELESKSLDSEAYYKKRRELDILKIEKENLEFGANLQIPNEVQLDELSQKINDIEDQIYSVEDTKSQIPFVVINVKESIKNFIHEFSTLRQFILINNK